MTNDDALNIELLYIFITVSDLKSINKSSDVLSLTQPAISKKIMQLEEYYGKQLFIRNSKGMVLTPTGKKIYQEAKKILSQIESLRSSIKSDSVALDKLNIGSLDSISSFKFPKFFLKALQEFNQTTITNKINELINPFNNGQLDVILMDSSFKSELSGTFFEKELYQESYYLVYSQDNPTMDQSVASLDATDLRKLDLLMYPKYCPIHKRLVQIYEQLNLTPPKIVEIDYSESTLALVENSNYVTVLPESIAKVKASADSNLSMTKLDSQFVRYVSLFARDKETLELIAEML